MVSFLVYRKNNKSGKLICNDFLYTYVHAKVVFFIYLIKIVCGFMAPFFHRTALIIVP
jgi:hypothetical protein